MRSEGVFPKQEATSRKKMGANFMNAVFAARFAAAPFADALFVETMSARALAETSEARRDEQD
jgi:hypothetical protein